MAVSGGWLNLGGQVVTVRVAVTPVLSTLPLGHLDPRTRWIGGLQQK